jgi:broad specificity phosphatase PhoE
MDREELYQLAAEKAVAENSWDSIEFLCKPMNQFELLLRLSFEGAKQLAYDWLNNDAPDAMPHRHRGEYWDQLDACIKFEEFYRRLCEVRERINRKHNTIINDLN